MGVELYGLSCDEEKNLRLRLIPFHTKGRRLRGPKVKFGSLSGHLWTTVI